MTGSRRHIPVRMALTGWYLLVLGIVIAIFSATVYLAQERALDIQLDQAIHIAGRQALALVNDDVEPPRFVTDETFGHVTRHLNDAGYGVALLDSGGRIIEQFGRAFPWPAQPPTTPGLATLTDGGKPWRADWRAVQNDSGAMIGWLGAGLSLGAPQESLHTLYRIILWSIPVALIVAGLAGYGLARIAMRPVDRMTRFVRGLGAGDLDKRLNQHGPDDELGRLSRTLDDLLARLQGSFERERRFVADAAHELRTPLAAMKSRLEIIAGQDRDSAAYRAALQDIASEVERLIRLVRDLLLLARLEQGSSSWETAPVDISQLCERTVEQMQALAGERDLDIDADIAPELMIEGSMDHLLRALINLLDNAIKYSVSPGEIRIEARPVGDAVQIAIMNTSALPGLALPSRLGERFLRGDGSRSRESGGAGLGLAIASEIARRHQGSLTLATASDGQAVATLALGKRFRPAAQAKPELAAHS
jgi:signal transduction histidine kinase